MVLLNIPYNVLASSDLIEEILTKDNNVILRDEDLINSDIVTNNSELIINSESNLIENPNNNIDISVETRESESTTSITNYAKSFAGGNGTEQNPYQISNALEFSRLAYLVNEGNLDTTNMYFELTSDIDLKDFDCDNDNTNGNWIPIGFTTSSPIYRQVGFKGVFNGNNYTISNISILKNDNSSSGVFGYAKNATFKNLNLHNILLDNGYNSGALIGYGDSNIILDNINIENISINNSSMVGGIIGYMYGELLTIENSSVITDVIGCKDSLIVGGLVGCCNSYVKILNNNIKANLSTKNYVGGLIGQINCYNGTPVFIIDNNTINSIIDLNFSGYEAGGVIGYVYISTFPDVVTISNISYEGSIINSNASAYNGGLFGYYSAYNSKYNTILKISHINLHINDMNGCDIGGLIGYSSNNDIYCDDINILMDGQISSTYIFGGLIGMQSTSNYNIEVSNFNLKAKNIIKTKYGGGLIGNSYSSISLDSSNFDFNLGTLNDNDTTYYGGIVGYADSSDGGISFLINKTHISMNTFESKSPFNHVGGYFGYYGVYGMDNSITVTNSNHIGNLFGDYVGGLIGYSYKDLNLALKNFYTIGDRLGNISSSGIANSSGTNIYLNMENSYLAGNIESENDNNYLITSVKNTYFNIVDTYYDNTICNLSSDYFIGLTTEQMQGLNAKENMTFDYDNIWKLNRDYYPTFNQLNTAPKLQGSDIELTLNQDYNLLDYITVEDFEDKGLVPEIVTDLDITKIGNYTVTFTVIDPQGLSDELTVNIKVVMENPIINANDVEIFVNEDFDEKKGITAIDVDGTDITQYIKVIENTVNTKVAGVYKVVYEIESLNKSTIQKEIKVTVKEKVVVNDNNNSNKNETNKPILDENKNNSSTTKPQTRDNFIICAIVSLGSLISLLYINRKSKKE